MFFFSFYRNIVYKNIQCVQALKLISQFGLSLNHQFVIMLLLAQRKPCQRDTQNNHLTTFPRFYPNPRYTQYTCLDKGFLQFQALVLPISNFTIVKVEFKNPILQHSMFCVLCIFMKLKKFICISSFPIKVVLKANWKGKKCYFLVLTLHNFEKAENVFLSSFCFCFHSRYAMVLSGMRSKERKKSLLRSKILIPKFCLYVQLVDSKLQPYIVNQ